MLKISLVAQISLLNLDYLIFLTHFTNIYLYLHLNTVIPILFITTFDNNITDHFSQKISR